jgi:transcriptional regulator with XRE-family HTH domain
MSSITEQLRQAIRDFGTSQIDVAQDCGLSPSTVSRFLSGKGGLSLEAADRLARCLRVVLVSEQEWQRREVVWDQYQTGELRRRWDEI